MSEQLIQFISKHGGEAANTPFTFSQTQDKLDVITISEDSKTGQLTLNDSLTKTDLAKLECLIQNGSSKERDFSFTLAIIPVNMIAGKCCMHLTQSCYQKLLGLMGLHDLRSFAHVNPWTFDVLPRFIDGQITGVSFTLFISNVIGVYFIYEQPGFARGVIWTNDPYPRTDGINYNWITSLKEAISAFQHLAKDPYFLLFALVLHMSSKMDRGCSQLRRKVSDLERLTGYSYWSHEDTVTGLMKSKVVPHLAWHVAEMNGASTRLSGMQLVIEVCFKMLAAINQPIWQPSPSAPGPTSPLHIRLKEDLKVTESHLHNQASQATYIEARTRNQLAAVQSLLNRHEMYLNLQVADSMKILATVTMLFLPATFVASLFSTTMFDWHIAEGDFVSRHFWIYWVVTIPLTMATVVAFRLLTRRKPDLPEQNDIKTMKSIFTRRASLDEEDGHKDTNIDHQQFSKAGQDL